MNCEDIREILLVNNVDAEDVNLLYAEKFDETSLPYITEDLLLRVGLRLGPALKVLQIFRHVMAVNNPTNAVELPDVVNHLELPSKRSANIANDFEGSEFIKGRDLLQVLRDCQLEQVPTLIRQLERGEALEDKLLNLLIRVLVDDLLARSGNYPPTSCKEALAINIVKTWPHLGQKCNPRTNAHFLLFNTDSSTIPGRRKNGGKIENRVDTLMRRLPPEERRYNKRAKVVNVEVEVVDMPIENSTNKQDVIEYVRSTFEVRNQLRKAKSSAADILKRFPMMILHNGELIDLEFELLQMHDRMDISDTVLEGLLPKISAKSKIDFQVNDNVLKGILSLVASVPRSKKKTVMQSDDMIGWAVDGMIHWIHAEDDLDGFIQTAKKSNPYVICVTEAPSAHADGDFHVTVDNYTVMDVGSCILRAMEVLYKTYHVFNLQYPPEYKTFFGFLDSYIFKYKSAKPSGPLDKFFKSLG